MILTKRQQNSVTRLRYLQNINTLLISFDIKYHSNSSLVAKITID